MRKEQERLRERLKILLLYFLFSFLLFFFAPFSKPCNLKEEREIHTLFAKKKERKKERESERETEQRRFSLEVESKISFLSTKTQVLSFIF